MSDVHADYLFDLAPLIMDRALDARRRRDGAPLDSAERAFHAGRVLAFNEVISIMLQQAAGIGIPPADLRLEGVEPDRDLL